MVVPSHGSYVLDFKCFFLAWKVSEKLNIYLLIQNLCKHYGLVGLHCKYIEENLRIKSLFIDQHIQSSQLFNS